LLSLERELIISSLACALTPFVLFNQQILTGRSLQSFHYEVFIGNYLTTAAVVLLGAGLFRVWRISERRLSGPVLTLVAAAALLSALAETTLSSRRQLAGNIIRDDARPALRRLASLGRLSEGQLDTQSVVYAPDFVVTSSLAATAPQPVLWAQHMFNFPGVSLEEDKERLAQFLYYQGTDYSHVDEHQYAALDSDTQYYLASLIRRGRFNPRLVSDWEPIAPGEVRAALDYYNQYAAAFNRERAARPALSYLLVRADAPVNLTNLDRWYERDTGELISKYVLYRVRLR
jgi:hypothetical protein